MIQEPKVIQELLVIPEPKVQLVIPEIKVIPEPKVIPELKVLTYEFAWHSRIPLLWMHG